MCLLGSDANNTYVSICCLFKVISVEEKHLRRYCVSASSNKSQKYGQLVVEGLEFGDCEKRLEKTEEKTC